MSHSSRFTTIALRLLLAAASLAVLPSTGWAQIASVVGDATISQTNPAINFGALPNLTVSPGNASLIQFDLSSLPAGLNAAGIQKATLTIYVNRVLVSGALDFAVVGSAWTENTVTWNTAPLLASFAAGVPANSAGFLTVDVTNQVKDWVTNPGQNYGLAVQTSVGAPTTSVILDSKENTATSHPAFLNIVLASSGGGSGPSGPSGPTGPSGPSGPAGPAGGPQGPTGPSGPAGPAGVAGPTGPSGPAGVAGATGASGPAGPAGITGASGPAGVAGPAGASGPAGPAGITGASGPAGVAGPTGASGPAGPAGITGASGASGPAGVAGATGATGPFGVAGPAGPTGATGVAGPAGTNGAGVFGASIINPTTGTSFYVALNGTQQFSTNSPEFTGISMPVACTFDRLSLSLATSNALGTGALITATLVKNGVDQGTLSCSAISSLLAGGIVTCFDNSGTVAVAIGDIVGLHLTQTTGVPTVRIGIGTRCN